MWYKQYYIRIKRIYLSKIGSSSLEQKFFERTQFYFLIFNLIMIVFFFLTKESRLPLLNILGEFQIKILLKQHAFKFIANYIIYFYHKIFYLESKFVIIYDNVNNSF